MIHRCVLNSSLIPPSFRPPPPKMTNKGAIGKLGKLKCMLKKWHAKSLHHRLDDDDKAWQRRQLHLQEGEEEQREEQPDRGNATGEAEKVPAGMQPVYVGKSRRRYLIPSHLACHPLFRVLVQKSGGTAPDDGCGGGPTAVVLGCEVVLFEHLLWMLENADPQPEALDELVDFYSC